MSAPNLRASRCGEAVRSRRSDADPPRAPVASAQNRSATSGSPYRSQRSGWRRRRAEPNYNGPAPGASLDLRLITLPPARYRQFRQRRAAPYSVPALRSAAAHVRPRRPARRDGGQTVGVARSQVETNGVPVRSWYGREWNATAFRLLPTIRHRSSSSVVRPGPVRQPTPRCSDRRAVEQTRTALAGYEIPWRYFDAAAN